MLRTRVLTALVLLAAFLVALFVLPPAGWLAFTFAVLAGAAWEWGGLVKLAGTARTAFVAAVMLVWLALAWFSGLARLAPEPGGLLQPALALGALFWIALAPVWLRRKWPLAGSGVPIGLLVLVPAGLALLYLRFISPWILLAGMALVWTADIAAYFVGRAFGRHRLAPNISPGKSWEGVAGAAVGVVAYGLALVTLAPALPIPARSQPLLLMAGLLLLTAVSVVGDLFESLAKRQAGVKDSGQLLPGHGGILDRIDSLTSTLPLLGLALTLSHS